MRHPTSDVVPAIAERAQAFLDRLALARGGGRQLRRLPEGGVVEQGYAYGLPAQRAPITRAERHVPDRFAC